MVPGPVLGGLGFVSFFHPPRSHDVLRTGTEYSFDSLGFETVVTYLWLAVSTGDTNVQFLFADHMIDTERRELHHGSEPIAVEPQVLDLLIYLVENRDRVVSKA